MPEVNFKLRSNRHIPPTAWQQNSGAGGGNVSSLIIVLGLLFLAIWFSLTSCKRENLVTVKTSDGKVFKVTPEEASGMYAAGGDVPWDFTKIKHPKEPGLDFVPDSSSTVRPNK
jgi:hypothetical protein